MFHSFFDTFEFNFKEEVNKRHSFTEAALSLAAMLLVSMTLVGSPMIFTSSIVLDLVQLSRGLGYELELVEA